MKIFYCDHFVLPLPDGHRFPMEKYRLLRARVDEAGVSGPGELRVPEPASDEALLRVHDAEYLNRVVAGNLSASEVRRIGFPWSPELVERSRRSVGGTMAACRAALDDGAAANLAGGTHHAFANRGEGFCVFNDVAVAVRDLQASGSIERASILDLDVHQGNGTASIFRHDPAIFTSSVHGARNFPFQKDESDLDLPLPDQAGDDAFLEAVRIALEATLELHRPQLLVYLAGADPYIGDRLGRLSVSREALAERDALVTEGAKGQGVPLALVMGGGYAEEVADTVEIHFNSIRAAAALAPSPGAPYLSGVPIESARRGGVLRGPQSRSESPNDET